MKIIKIPLRYSIPILIFIFNLILLSVEFQTDRIQLLRQGLQNSQDHLRETGMLASMQVESALRNNKPSTALDIINHAASLKAISSVYLINDQNEIIFTNDSMLEDSDFKNTSEFKELVTSESDTMDFAMKTRYFESRKILFNISEIQIGSGENMHLPDQLGYLIIKKDLRNEFYQIHQHLRAKAGKNLLIYLLFSFSIWAIFRFFFLNRINLIMQGFQDPDKLNYNLFNGRDELSELVSGLKKMHDNLVRQNKFTQTILDNLPLGVAVNKIVEGTATYINPQFEKIYGWPKDELKDVASYFNKVYPDKEYREKLQERVMNDINSKDPERMRWEKLDITTQQGEKKIISAQNIPVFEQNLMISTVQDVTPRERMRRDFDLIFENSIDMICTASLDGYLLTINPAWEKNLGWSEEELKSKPFIEFIHPEDHQSTLQSSEKLKAGLSALGFENRYRAKDGSYRYLSWNAIRLPGQQKMFGIARDITEKKESDKKLAQQEFLLRQTGRMARVGSWSLELETMTPYFTDETYNIYELPVGTPPEMEEGIKFYAPEARPIIQKVVAEAIEKHTPYDVELPFITAKGKKIWVRTIGEVEVKNGKAIRLLGAVQDITERKIAEKKLIQSEEKFSTIFKNSPDAIFLSEIDDGKIIDLNKAAEEILGYAFNELVGKKTTEIDFWKNLGDRETYVGRLRKSGRINNFEADFVVKNGDTRTFNTSGELIQLEGKEYILSILQDITEISKVRDELFTSRQQLRNITNNIPGALIQYKLFPDGKDAMLFVSGGAEKLWGITPEQAMNDIQLVWNKIHSDDHTKIRKSILKSYQENKIWNIEFRNVGPGDIENWTQGIGTPQKMADGSIVWDSLILDITERKEAVQQLEAYQRSLQQLTIELSLAEEKQRKEIAANIHDHLSQSLVISKMKLNDLQNKPEIKRYKRDLLSIRNHIADALENSRRITYDLSPPVLYEMGLVETIYWLIDKLEEENHLHIEFTTNVEKLDFSDAALILVYRSIQEILYNVIKHAEATRVMIQFKQQDQHLKIEIEDNGKGFDARRLEPESGNKKSFGLFKVRERIRNLNGQFNISSTPGKGTYVTFNLPLT